MDFQYSRKVGVKQNEIAQMEANLYKIYRPVSPRPEFVKILRTRLQTPPDTTLQVQRKGVLQYAVWTIAGLLSGTLILVLGVKGVMVLANNIKVMQQKNSTSLQSAV